MNKLFLGLLVVIKSSHPCIKGCNFRNILRQLTFLGCYIGRLQINFLIKFAINLKISFILFRPKTPCRISAIKIDLYSENERNEYLAACFLCPKFIVPNYLAGCLPFPSAYWAHFSTPTVETYFKVLHDLL